MGLTQLNFEGKNKGEAAIDLLRACEPSEGYYGADSGGVDSGAARLLARLAGVKVDWHYCVSPVDPPQVHRFLKENHPDTQWDYHARGFWKLVTRKGLPTRRSRWCCEYIKEAGGLGRVVIVGSRRNEGRKRRGQKCFEKHTKKNIFYVRPIIDWSREEVWELHKEYNEPYCPLYDEGFERLGCVMCPIASHKNRMFEMQRFPKIAKLWRLSCDRLIERRLAQGKDKFATGEELWKWWLGG